jgi:hypothetical protein
VLVPVPFVGGVTVTVVDEVGVVIVGNGYVPAALSVIVVVCSVGDVRIRSTFVPVVFVDAVGVTVVEVVGVVVVGDRCVPALGTVIVVVARMGLVGGGCHVSAPLSVP